MPPVHPPSPRPSTTVFRFFMPIMIALAITWSMGIILVTNNPKRRAESYVSIITREEESSIPKRRHLTTTTRKASLLFGQDVKCTLSIHSPPHGCSRVSKFLQVNVSNMNTVEEGCFEVFRTFPKAVRMTLDWLDFSVEHMSKWWKTMDIYGTEGGIPFHRAVTAFQAYTRSVTPHKGESPLQATFAIVAFQSLRILILLPEDDH